MKKALADTCHYFVDEAGDPTFYNEYGSSIVGKEGCSKTLILGFIRTEHPEILRYRLTKLHKEIVADPYLQSIPSLAKTRLAFHAKDDCPEIREKVFKLIADLDFTAEFVVARKIESIFQRRHRSKPSIFYDDLISKLFQNKLHLAKQNFIYFAVRSNKTRQGPLEDAIQVAVNAFEEKWDTKIDSVHHILPQSPVGEPCLQIVDYMNWAVQRAFHKGEDRYYKFVADKISFLCDIYDFSNYPKNFYSRNNPFEIKRISPL